MQQRNGASTVTETPTRPTLAPPEKRKQNLWNAGRREIGYTQAQGKRMPWRFKSALSMEHVEFKVKSAPPC
jgi:hypothetical protein